MKNLVIVNNHHSRIKIVVMIRSIKMLQMTNKRNKIKQKIHNKMYRNKFNKNKVKIVSIKKYNNKEFLSWYFYNK
jgi:hypothetical protein